jgi:hypothetical protein
MAVGRKKVVAHREYYERANGPIPPGLQLDHLCRNRGCVNPDHLEPVTAAENVQRSSKAKLDAEAVAEIRTATGLQREIAARFGVSPSTVSLIRGGKRWV